MSLLNGNSRFSEVPSNKISRSLFDRSNTLLTSLSAGKLVPIYVDECLPGDTVTMDMSSLVRMATPLYPVMDNAWIDYHWFFVPSRLVWENWKFFMGETRDAWDSDTEYEIPTDRVYVKRGSFYDYAGLPCDHIEGNTAFFDVSALPRRAYWLIWNEWYRDQSLQDSKLIDLGDVGLADVDATSLKGPFDLLPVNKYKDYFTSALPEPQRGENVLIPGLSSDLPVFTSSKEVPATLHEVSASYGIGLSLLSVQNGAYVDANSISGYSQLFTGSTSGRVVKTNSEGSYDISTALSPTNLWASVSDAAGASINALRQAFAVQRLLEADARGGTRYRELVKSHFGVDNGDARMQVPEYLGGAHVPINVMQVVQMSSTASEPSPLGETGAMSKTVHRGNMFTKTFTEHGFLMGFASVRTQHSYSQGVNRFWSRRNRLDFYWPELANIGEQAILNKELYAQGVTSAIDDEVFGYQEAWADYRYKPNQITGRMRQTSNTITADESLAVWHYGDYYSELPALSDEWIRETPENIARTLAVSDTKVFDQFLCDFYFQARWARPLPVYSIPGLSGHF